MGISWTDRLKTWFPADGLGWKIPSLVAALIAIAGLITLVGKWIGIGTVEFWESVLDALSDFLTADVVVWHLLLAVAAAGAVALVVWWFARWQPGNREGRMTDNRPVEVEKFGVLWPIIHPHVGGLQVGKPMCLRDRSTLGQFLLNKLVSLSSDWDDSMTAPEMNLGCPKEGCGRKYDLTGHKYAMQDMTGLVHDVAMGEWRAAERTSG